MGKTIVKKALPKKRAAKAAVKKSDIPDGTVQPSAKAMRILERFADEERIPRSWLDSKDDPTVAD